MKQSDEDFIKRATVGLFIFLLLLSLIFVAKAWSGGHFQSREALRAYLETFGGLGPVVLALIQALQVILPVMPGFLGCIVGAMMFGMAGGFWINYIGISAGSILAYWLARWFGVRFVRKMIPLEKYDGFVKWVHQRKSYAVVLFLAILLPLAPDDFLCYFSGLTSMSARKFTWIIILGKPWCILLYSVIFANIA